MSVLGFASNKGFIHFDNPAQLGHITSGHRHSDSVAHVPGRFVGAEAHVSANLQGTYSFFAGQHQVGDLEPIHQRLIRILENRSRDVREAIGRHWRTLVALPMPGVASQGFGVIRATTRTLHAIRPTLADKVFTAGFLIRKRLMELWDGQLVKKFLSGPVQPSKFDGWSIAWLN